MFSYRPNPVRSLLTIAFYFKQRARSFQCHRGDKHHNLYWLFFASRTSATMRLSIAIGLMLGALAFVTAQDTPQDVAPDVEKPIFICPLPRCRQCPSTQRRTALGVGFALEIGMGETVHFLLRLGRAGATSYSHTGRHPSETMMVHSGRSPISRAPRNISHGCNT